MMDTKLTDIKRFVDELQAGIQSMEETKYNLEFEKKENQKIFKVYENMEQELLADIEDKKEKIKLYE